MAFVQKIALGCHSFISKHMIRLNYKLTSDSFDIKHEIHFREQPTFFVSFIQNLSGYKRLTVSGVIFFVPNMLNSCFIPSE